MAALLNPSFFLHHTGFIFMNPSLRNPFSSDISSTTVLHQELRKNSRAKAPKTLSASATDLQTAVHRDTSFSNPSMQGLFILFREFGFNERETEALLHKNPSLASASFESIRSRVLSLQSVVIDGFAIVRLIIKRPEILVVEEVAPFLNYVLENLEGIEPLKLERLLMVTDPQFFDGFEKKVNLLISHGIPREEIVRVLNKVNLKVFCYREFDEIDRSILYLKHYGISVNWIIRRPMLLNLDLNKQLIPKARLFTDLGGEEKATKLLSKFPPILAYSVEHLKAHIDFWRSVGLTDEEIFKILLIYPNVFSVGKEKKLTPRVEFLRECGFCAEDIYKFLTRAPLFLSLSFEGNLCKKLSLLMKLGYKHGTRDLAWALGAVTRTSCQNMQMVIGVFLSYGFSCEDVMVMSKKHPQILQYNYQSLDSKMDYLIEGLGRDIGELLSFPAFLGYKLDERIKHRYEVKKETRGVGMSLNKLLSVSTERFFLTTVINVKANAS